MYTGTCIYMDQSVCHIYEYTHICIHTYVDTYTWREEGVYRGTLFESLTATQIQDRDPIDPARAMFDARTMDGW